MCLPHLVIREDGERGDKEDEVWCVVRGAWCVVDGDKFFVVVQSNSSINFLFPVSRSGIATREDDGSSWEAVGSGSCVESGNTVDSRVAIDSTIPLGCARAGGKRTTSLVDSTFAADSASARGGKRTTGTVDSPATSASELRETEDFIDSNLATGRPRGSGATGVHSTASMPPNSDVPGVGGWRTLGAAMSSD